MSKLGRAPARPGAITLVREPLDDHDAHAVTPLLRALADPVRLRLLSLIGAAGDAGTTVCDLADEFNLSQPTLSHHLAVLRKAGLVAGRRRRTWVFYRVVPGALDRVARLFS